MLNYRQTCNIKNHAVKLLFVSFYCHQYLSGMIYQNAAVSNRNHWRHYKMPYCLNFWKKIQRPFIQKIRKSYLDTWRVHLYESNKIRMNWHNVYSLWTVRRILIKSQRKHIITKTSAWRNIITSKNAFMEEYERPIYCFITIIEEEVNIFIF